MPRSKAHSWMAALPSWCGSE
ncbi:MAG: hypothetical protein RL385_5713, partial [Pseudomonadota bacterium]